MYTSTVNVTFGGKPIEQGNEESIPYFPLDKVPISEMQGAGCRVVCLEVTAQSTGMGRASSIFLLQVHPSRLDSQTEWPKLSFILVCLAHESSKTR